MIRINLAKKKNPKGSGGGFKLSSVDISSISGIFTKGGDAAQKIDFKNSPVVKALIGIVIVYVVQSTLEEYRGEALKAINGQIEAVEKQITDIQNKLSQVKGYEEIKAQLDEDEKTVRTKLDVVTTLLDNRDGPVKMMLQVAQSLPEDVWLTELLVTGPAVRFLGGTQGFNQASDFLKALTNSSLFDDITLSGIQEATVTGNEQKYQSFEINAKRRSYF